MGMGRKQDEGAWEEQPKKKMQAFAGRSAGDQRARGLVYVLLSAGSPGLRRASVLPSVRCGSGRDEL